MTSALVEMDVKKLSFPSAAPTLFCTFDEDSDTSSTSSSSGNSCLSNTNCNLQINKVQDIPDIIINNFDFNGISSFKHLSLRFFITKCTPEVLGTFLKGGFLETLYNSASWKVFMTELVYGYLNYVINSEKNSNESQYPIGFIQQLKDLGKIVTLRKHIAQTVDLSEETVDHFGEYVRIKATALSSGLISQIIQFDIAKYTPELRSISSRHTGTFIPHDIMLNGCYPTFPYEKGGFPLECMSNNSKNSAAKVVFSRRLKKLAHAFCNPKVQFKLRLCDSDKLVDLWYMKNLSDQFSTKIHVTPHYFEFVVQFISQFADCFTLQNHNGEARIHYDCCSTLVNSEYSCRLLGSTVHTIWVNGKAEKANDINLPFIHEL